jgi:hypothetical protein
LLRGRRNAPLTIAGTPQCLSLVSHIVQCETHSCTGQHVGNPHGCRCPGSPLCRPPLRRREERHGGAGGDTRVLPIQHWRHRLAAGSPAWSATREYGSYTAGDTARATGDKDLRPTTLGETTTREYSSYGRTVSRRTYKGPLVPAGSQHLQRRSSTDVDEAAEYSDPRGARVPSGSGMHEILPIGCPAGLARLAGGRGGGGATARDVLTHLTFDSCAPIRADRSG